MTCILHQTAQIAMCIHFFLILHPSIVPVLCPLDYQANAIYLELERMGESNCCTMCRHTTVC